MSDIARTIGRKYGLQLGIFVLLIAVFAIIAPSFGGTAAAYATLERIVLLGIITAGLAVTMIAGELDLSIPGMAVFGGVIAVQLSDLGLFPSIAVAAAAGTALGLLQGWLIAKLDINSMVFTVGMLTVLQGVSWLLAGGSPIAVENYLATDPLLEQYWIFSPLSLTAVVVMVLIGLFLTWSKWGREIFAIGGARHEAVAAGVSVRRSMVLAFGISGFAGALAGALSSMKSGSVTPDSFSEILLTCVTAALVGGVSLYGGRGNIVNIALGVIIIAMLAAGLSAMGVPSYVTQLLTGTLLLVVIVIEFIIAKASARSRLRRLRAAHE
ncbi:ABC transporter permease [Leucobacter allii]|uniref:ABC transporter permease n=1 Tax=Leucobacter allii TaxID=2932247 RepID=UPI001FD1903D|nr:ABC transporter permease [Leucobacter allii]UOR01330.1 ABC transporter permease [Leucobacter allii]